MNSGERLWGNILIEGRARRRSLLSTGSIGKYSLEETIRVQPTRTLCRSYDPFLDRKVIIKIIQLLDPLDENDNRTNETFFAEARAIGRLQHQNIISVYDAGVGDYEGYIVMEYVEGESLLHKLKAEKVLSLDLTLKIACQICHALEYAHSKNVIHRDIKPSNIMLTDEGNVKVVDFGISVLDDNNNSSVLMGTPSYLAPELINNALPSAQSDLYSLAVLIYEMVLGRLPYPGNDAHAVMYKIINTAPDEIVEDIPELFKSLLLKALSKSPEDRFQTCAEFENGLIELQEEISDIYHNQALDTVHIQGMQIFKDCNAKILHELADCLVYERIQKDELLFDKNLLDEYICLVHGKALLVAADEHIIVSTGQWLTEKVIQQKNADYSCKTLTNSLLVRVSKSNILEASQATQAYFFSFILDRIFIY